MYKKLKQCIHNHLQKNHLPIVMKDPTKEAEIVISTFLGDMESFGMDYWSGELRKKGDYGSTDDTCPCYSRGTLCTNCIVKKFANGKKN